MAVSGRFASLRAIILQSANPRRFPIAKMIASAIQTTEAIPTYFHILHDRIMRAEWLTID